MRKFLAHSTLAVFAVFCLWLPAMAQSQPKNSPDTAQSSTNHNQTDSNTQAQARMNASKYAVRALRLTDQARQSIINKDQSRATHDVQQALDLISQAGEKLPATGDNNTHVVPIFAELEQTSFLQPVLAAKKESSNGEQQMASTQNPSSQESALPQSDQPPVVKRVEGGYSYIGLDLNAAKEHLQQAKQYLSNNESGKADVELARAQQSVDTGSITTDMPLVRARENLSLARNEAQDGHYSQAKVNLTAASKALTEYGNSSQAKHANDAKDLSNQIKSFSGKIANHHQNAQSKIENWWNQVAGWTGQKSS